MDRYTQHDRFGHFVPLASAECGEWTLAGKFEKRLYGDAASRLAAYEDTGLMPEEVIALRDAKDTNVPTTPFTLDELRGMDGEPVWVQELPPYTTAGYKVLAAPAVNEYGDICFDGGDCYAPYDYGKAWLAYRYKKRSSR